MSDFKYSAANIDANILEKQQDELTRKTTTTSKLSFDPKNYLNLSLGENESSKTVKIRFLPISATDGTVFLSILTHALKVDKEVARSGFKTFVCLSDDKIESNDECPICKKAKELYKKSSDAKADGNMELSKTFVKEANSLKKKTTFIARVIDRDHEDEGVKFWRFNYNSKGEGIHDKLMALYNTRRQESIEDGEKEPYNIFDLYNGKDIIITITKTKIPDGYGGMKDATSYNITDSGNRKPLSKDVEQANGWLNDPKTWKDVYSSKTADYLEVIAEGKIPVYSRDLGKFVEKTEFNTEAKKMEEIAATEVLTDRYRADMTLDVANNLPPFDTTPLSDDDLPF